jgi:hypothetical protein
MPIPIPEIWTSKSSFAKVGRVEPHKRKKPNMTRIQRAALRLTMVASIAVFGQQARADITLDFSNLTGAKIQFNGNTTFDFVNNVSGESFNITSAGSSLGDLGNISGTFTIGTVVLGVAPVNGSGTLTILDNNHVPLTGTVVWENIAEIGTLGALNIQGQLNLSSIAYAGSQPDLVALDEARQGTTAVTFQFSSPKTLSYLQTHSISTSFSGSISAVVPEPSTLLAGALLILPFGLSALRIMRRSR